MPGADAAGDVHLPPRQVSPQAAHRVDQRLVAGVGGHVGRAAIKIHRPHRMADDFALLPHRLVVLDVDAPNLPPGLVAPHVDEERGQIDVTLLAGRLLQLHQGQFDLFMAAGAAPLRRAERVVDAIGIADGHVEKCPLPVARQSATAASSCGRRSTTRAFPADWSTACPARPGCSRCLDIRPGCCAAAIFAITSSTVFSSAEMGRPASE